MESSVDGPRTRNLNVDSVRPNTSSVITDFEVPYFSSLLLHSRTKYSSNLVTDLSVSGYYATSHTPSKRNIGITPEPIEWVSQFYIPKNSQYSVYL